MNQNTKIIGVFLLAAYFAKIILVPIFLALFLAMLLEPIVRWLVSLKLSRMGASTLVILAAGAGFTVMGWLAYTAGLELVSAFPVYMLKINALVASVNRMLGLPDLRLAAPGFEWGQVFYTSLGSIYEAASILIFVPLLMFYFLSDKDNLLESFNVVNGRYFNLPKLNFELPRMLRVFFAANIVTFLFLVLAHGIMCIGVGFDNWISLALLTAFLNLLPLAGGPAAVVAVLLLGIGVKMTVPLILGLAAVTMGLHFLANNLMVPLLVGARLNMNAVALIIGLMFWSWVWGVAGFFLAVPMTALIKILLECNPETYAFANLMSAKPKRVLAGRRAPLFAGTSSPSSP